MIMELRTNLEISLGVGSHGLGLALAEAVDVLEVGGELAVRRDDRVRHDRAQLARLGLVQGLSGEGCWTKMIEY